MEFYQFYIEYMIKRAKPYNKSPGWALRYSPYPSDSEICRSSDYSPEKTDLSSYITISNLIM